MIKTSCLHCKNMYTKEPFDDSEEVCICGLDNHYIGYQDEANKETCKSFKSMPCNK